jgi:uncharacterized protein involved in cysteine biosynthesis
MPVLLFFLGLVLPCYLVVVAKRMQKAGRTKETKPPEWFTALVKLVWWFCCLTLAVSFSLLFVKHGNKHGE